MVAVVLAVVVEAVGAIVAVMKGGAPFTTTRPLKFSTDVNALITSSTATLSFPLKTHHHRHHRH
jgi:hypothetical protein